ncbi:MAG: hypothetical protein KDA22_01770 [Phycisphaerales bacterium]|nr:hypothetical protein [Phycisphaerales bacterium]
MRTSTGTYIMVTIVSLMIWLWAAAVAADSRTISVQVSIEPPPGMVLLSGPTLIADQQVTVSGTVAEVDRAIDDMRPEIRIQLGRYDLPKDAGEIVLPIGPAIEAMLGRTNHNVSVSAKEKDGRTSEVVLRVDKLVAKNYLIELDVPGVEIDGQPTISPREAKVLVPESLLALRAPLRLRAEIGPSELEQVDRGGRLVTEARLRLYSSSGPLDPGEPGVSIQPALAMVSFRVASRTATITVGEAGTGALGVPVQIALPPADTARYEVTIDPKDSFLRNVRLSGAADAITALREGRFKVLAFVQLSSDDLDRAVLEGGETIKPVSMWSLPNGVSVVDPGQTDYQIEQDRLPDRKPRGGIRVMVKRRSDPAATP